MLNKRKIALIGLGAQATEDHVPAVLRRNDIDLISVCDIDKKARNKFKNKYRSVSDRVNTYSDYRKMIEKESPDYAIVAVPHNVYPDIVRFLTTKRIYFMKEKPLARNLNEAYIIESLPQITNYSFICTQRRYNKLYQTAKEKLAELGTLYQMRVIYTLNISDPHKGWRGLCSSAGGGCILDMGYHIIDQLVWWFGLPDSIFAKSSALAVEDAVYDAEDSATIAFFYNSGLHGSIILSRNGGDKREQYKIYGSRGSMTGDGQSLVLKDREGKTVLYKKKDTNTQALDSQLDYFIHGAKSGQGFTKNHEQNLLNMQFVEMCYKSSGQRNYIKKEDLEVGRAVR